MSFEMKQLNELKVSELRTELEKRGIDRNGNKAVLMQRLEQVFVSISYVHSFLLCQLKILI